MMWKIALWGMAIVFVIAVTFVSFFLHVLNKSPVAWDTVPCGYGKTPGRIRGMPVEI